MASSFDATVIDRTDDLYIDLSSARRYTRLLNDSERAALQPVNKQVLDEMLAKQTAEILDALRAGDAELAPGVALSAQETVAIEDGIPEEERRENQGPPPKEVH